MSKNRKNRKEPAYLRNFTRDVLQRKIWLEESYAKEHSNTIDGLKVLTETLNKYIQDLNLEICRNIPYISLKPTTGADDAVRMFIRQQAQFDEPSFMLQIGEHYIGLTHFIDLFVSEGVFELDHPSNEVFDAEIIFNSDYTRMVIIDIFLDVAMFNSYSFLRDADTEEKQAFSKKKYEYFRSHHLSTCFDEVGENLDYYSFAFSCHDISEETTFSINLEKYRNIWEDFIHEYYPNSVHKERPIEQQLKMRVDKHLPSDYHNEFDDKEPGIYFVLRLNRADLSPDIHGQLLPILGGKDVGFSNLKIVTKTELSKYGKLLRELYISAFKVVKQEKDSIKSVAKNEEAKPQKSGNNHCYKIAVSFTSKYREKYVEPFCNALLKLGYSKDDIFYDNWHKVRFNGPNGGEIMQNIYKNDCRMIVVLLSPDYIERRWTGINEWPVIEGLINSRQSDKICLLSVDSVDLESISAYIKTYGIVEDVSNMRPDEIAKFINDFYNDRIISH
ncbi:MAG: hypothetical protein J6C38_00185 [Oscillospiraceae bacterium]|nr:hypothetical protein [Oscillospiraceae bacterium]